MPIAMKIPIGEGVERGVNWLTIHWEGFFDGLKNGLNAMIGGINSFLIWIPFIVFVLLILFLAWWVSGKGLAIFAGIGLVLVENLGLWSQTMETLSLVLTATLISLIIGLPLGILMAKSNIADKILRPVLDFMQTMPAFVYLIPAVYFFDLGSVPGVFATIIFAMPPVVRLTNLGVRGVPRDVVEAAKSFGATPSQLLFKVQIPLAIPTVMAGLNQTIMLSLSMVVISAMIGAEGLGKIVLKGITQMKIGQGFEGGLAVVIVAMILDRITQCFGNMNKKSGSVFVKEYRKKKARRS
ncbi:ABC transporter permease [Blautia liquoris]